MRLFLTLTVTVLIFVALQAQAADVTQDTYLITFEDEIREASSSFNLRDIVVNQPGGVAGGLDSSNSNFALLDRALVSQTVADLYGSTSHVGIPDDGVIPASGGYPQAQLLFDNEDNGDNASWLSVGSISIDVPEMRYTDLYFYMTNGDSSAGIYAVLHYADDNVEDGQDPSTFITVPSHTDPPAGSAGSVLIGNLDLWDLGSGAGLQQGNSSVFRLHLIPDSNYSLAGIDLAPGGGLSVFLLGASGVAIAEPLPGLSGWGQMLLVGLLFAGAYVIGKNAVGAEKPGASGV